MRKVKEIKDFLFSLAPYEYKMSFDNVGLLVGSDEKDVNNIMIALDITTEVIDEAIENDCQLIVSHHPVIWDAMKSVCDDNVQSKKIIKLLQNDISALCFHTNMDIADGGVNDVLIETIGAQNDGIFEITGDNVGVGRIGHYTSPVSFTEFLDICKTNLNGNGLRYYYAGNPVEKIAVLGGSGGDCVSLAKELGCDTYVTSDIKYDQFLLAKEIGLNLIDADHFCTENPIVNVFKSKISSEFKDLNCMISKRHNQVASFY